MSRRIFKKDIEVMNAPGKKVGHFIDYIDSEDDGEIETAQTSCGLWLHAKGRIDYDENDNPIPKGWKPVIRRVVPAGEVIDICSFCLRGREHPLALHDSYRDY